MHHWQWGTTSSRYNHENFNGHLFKYSKSKSLQKSTTINQKIQKEWKSSFMYTFIIPSPFPFLPLHCTAMAETKESKIPVFTVLKNGAILKNIFIVNKPPAESSPPSSSEPNALSTAENAEDQEQELEDILFVGRHPDCNIMLTHPSISRFHLQINSRPSSQKLSVVDLSSGNRSFSN